MAAHTPQPTSSDLAGMSVNERLFHLGLLNAFDAAVKLRQHSELVHLLVSAQLTESQAIQTATAVLENPKRYGY